MFSKVNKLPSFEFSEVTSNFTNPFSGFNKSVLNRDELKDYIYNMLNISEETKNLIDDCLLDCDFEKFLSAKITFELYGNIPSDKEKQNIDVSNKLFLELINNNRFESLDIECEIMYGKNLIDLIFNLYLIDKSFVLDEQQIIKYLQIKNKIDFIEFYHGDFLDTQENFYDRITDLFINDKYFNIIIDKPALFISIVGCLQCGDISPLQIITIFSKLKSYGFDADIFEWSYNISKLSDINVDNCDCHKDRKLKLINNVLKCDIYIKKLNIKNDEKLAKCLNL